MKVRRRLKPQVKAVLYVMLLVIVILVMSPWSWFSSSANTVEGLEQSEPSLQEDTTPIAINRLLSNDDSNLEEARKFDRVVSRFMNKWDMVGATLAIMKDGNLIYAKGYGWADREDSTRMEVSHILRIASVSKLITAVGVMKLAEQGKLRLTDRIFAPGGVLAMYSSSFTDKRILRITIDDLLRHKAGFSVRAGDPMFDISKQGLALPVTPSVLIAHCLGKGLRYTPGGRTAYSNFGYLILSELIAQVSSKSYEQFIKDEILNPIGCHDMHLGHSRHVDKHSNEVRYYEPNDSELIPACDGSGALVPKSDGGNDIFLLSGAGGWVASPTELLRFITAIDPRNPQTTILSQHSIALMTAYDKGSFPIGWMKTNGQGDWWRSGTMAGTSAMLRRQNNGYTWVFITNTSSWKGSRFPNLISGMFREAFGTVADWPEKDMFEVLEQEQVNDHTHTLITTD